MFVHIVCFKYKAGVAAAERQEHKARVCALADIDGVVEIAMGRDLIRSPRSADMGLLVLFRDQQAYENYRDHPRHQPVGQLSISLCESIVAADFEAEGWSDFGRPKGRSLQTTPMGAEAQRLR